MPPDETIAIVEETTEAPSIDMEKAVGQISESLFPEHETPTEAVAEALVTKEAPAPVADAKPATLTTPTVPEVSTPPKSWPKDMHQHWGAVPKAVQEYYQGREKQFLDGLEQYKSDAQIGQSIQKVLQPFQAALQASGWDAPRAVQSLLTAHSRLTTGTMEERQAAYRELGQRLNLALPANGSDPATPIDPRIQTLEQQFQQMQQALTAQQQAALTVAREKATAEVNAFASDPAHANFDEVADDVIKFIALGFSLPDAYDKAVWANPVTREKQVQDRVQTETEKALERKRLDALPKQKARGVNVNGRDTQRTPTDPLGSMDDTMRSTMKTIKERTAH